MDPAAVITGSDIVVPEWDKILRLFPISMWTAGAIGVGWWARGHSDRAAIRDFAPRDKRDRVADDG